MNTPKWMKTFPQSDLSKKLHGVDKRYDHEVICSGDHRKPIGHPGCICLKRLRGTVK